MTKWKSHFVRDPITTEETMLKRYSAVVLLSVLLATATSAQLSCKRGVGQQLVSAYQQWNCRDAFVADLPKRSRQEQSAFDLLRAAILATD
jgi:hypothetical protein